MHLPNLKEFTGYLLSLLGEIIGLAKKNIVKNYFGNNASIHKAGNLRFHLFLLETPALGAVTML